MKRNFVTALFATALVALTLTSCGKVPQTEIDSAKAAVETLKTQQADIYLTEEFTAVQDSLNVALESVEKASSKSMFRNYDAAKAQLEYVTTTSVALGERVEAVKTQVIAETEAAIAAAKTILEENKVLVEKAPKGKEGKAAIDAIKAELVVLETSLAETATLFEAGNYMAAKDKVTAATEKLNSINAELKAVIEKVKK
jgi:hypothetical protein